MLNLPLPVACLVQRGAAPASYFCMHKVMVALMQGFCSGAIGHEFELMNGIFVLANNRMLLQHATSLATCILVQGSL
jgi:hypothetical protein